MIRSWIRIGYDNDRIVIYAIMCLSQNIPHIYIYIYIYVRVSDKHEFKGKLLCSKLVRNISSNIFYFLADKADWAVAGCGTYKSKCGCLIWITYGLSYTCIIFKKIKLNTFIFFLKELSIFICLDETHSLEEVAVQRW